MPSDSLHSPVSSEDIDLLAEAADADNVYNEQNDHKKSKHRKHGKHKSKKHRKHRLTNLESGDENAQTSKRRKHKSSKHNSYDNELNFDLQPKPTIVNKPVVGYAEDLSDSELSFKDDKMVTYLILSCVYRLNVYILLSF